MMKISCLTCFIPRVENVGGPSGLLYQLLYHRPAKVEITVFLAVESKPNCLDEIPEVSALRARGIRFEPLPRIKDSGSVGRSLWPKGARQLASFDIKQALTGDVVWAYPYWFAPFIPAGSVVSGMDCATLLYYRRLKHGLSLKERLVALAGLAANAVFEAAYLRRHKVHVVGQQDCKVLRRLQVDAHFIAHPLLAYQHVRAIERRIGGGSLTLLLSNAEQPFYGSALARTWLMSICNSAKRLKVQVSLILHKPAPAFSSWALENLQPELTLNIVEWVTDYAELLAKVDCQLFPLEIGAGTKTSVLTALQHGVYAIASPTAAENIATDPLLLVCHRNEEQIHLALQHVLRSPVSAPGRTFQATHDPSRNAQAFWMMVSQK